MVVWIIGLSGAGKTTVAQELRSQIISNGRPCILLDGDVVRAILGDDLGHTLDDRRKNADRICRMCAYLDSQGVNVVCAILSIFHESQDWNRSHIEDYFEVFLDAPLDMVMQRDTKGIYARAKAGEANNVVGVDIEFPRPASPNLTLPNNFTTSPEELAASIFEKIEHKLS